MSALPDERLASMVGQGVEGAFEALYRRHRGRVLGLCQAMLGQPHDAEEATQAAMLSAYRALVRGRRPRTVGAWLAAIARNECLDLLRRRPVTVPLSGQVAAAGGDPAEQVERRERIDELRRDLADLPRGQRTALVLRGLGGMRHAEIARVVGGTANAARSLVHEARTTLGEFEEGRALGCADVRERIRSGDGRALRARSIRAHLRVCDECRAAATGRRAGLGAFLPAPLVAALRGLVGGGNAVPVAGGAAIASLATVGALLLPGPWAADPGRQPDRPPAASSAGQATPTTSTGPVVARTAAGRGGPLAPRAAGARGVPPPAAVPAVAPPPAPPSSSQPAPVPGSPAAGEGPATAPAAAPVTAPAAAPVTAPAAAPAAGPAAGPVTVAVSAPAVVVPSVTLPPATVPSVSVPAVTLPPVTVPSVTTPAITLPPVTTPALTTPPVAVEAAAAVTTPAVGPVPSVTVDLSAGGGSPIALP